jgi:hypothetical protein
VAADKFTEGVLVACPAEGPQSLEIALTFIHFSPIGCHNGAISEKYFGMLFASWPRKDAGRQALESDSLTIPKGLHLSAQRWPDAERAYPG